MLAAPVAVARTILPVEAGAVNVGVLTVVAASGDSDVAFHPVGCAETVLEPDLVLVTVALAQVRYLVTVKVVEKDEVTVTVVSLVQSPS